MIAYPSLSNKLNNSIPPSMVFVSSLALTEGTNLQLPTVQNAECKMQNAKTRDIFASLNVGIPYFLFFGPE